MVIPARARATPRMPPLPRSAVTRDGVHYRVRPIRPDDGERERQFMRGLSDESRYNRLMHAVREPSADLIDQLVHVDYRQSMALAAVVGERAEERFIGVASYAAGDAPDACEFAIAIADDWQLRGVATTLLSLLFQYAKAVGIRRTYGTILANNANMVSLAHWLGLRIEHDPADPRVLVASGPLR